MNCVVCNSSRVVTISKNSNYLILQCSDCGLSFASPMEFLQDNWYQRSPLYHHRDTAVVTNPRKDWRFNLFKQKTNLNEIRKLLDVGCGEGDFLYNVQHQNVRTYGLDFDKRAIQAASARCRSSTLKVGTLESISDDSEWNQFDVITAFDLVEHLASPITALLRIHGLLKINGLLFVTVPRFDRRPKLFDVLIDSPPHHFTLWTKRSLVILLQQAGFNMIEVLAKPLTAEDLVQHFAWRLRRVWGKLSLSWFSDACEASPFPSYPSDFSRKARAFLGTINLSWIGKGHSLFAVARRND